jgi:hypothetical protein
MKSLPVGLAALFSILLLTAPEAHAWGCKGHQTVALIAEKHLTAEARQMVETLLKNNPIDPKLKRYCGDSVHDAMADASSWPDDVRSEKKNGPWHYIDIPRGAPRGPLEAYCGEKGCVTRAITEQAALLKDKNADAAKRADALRYVIHFVGDLHQPLHSTTNADEGGNCVPVKYFWRQPRERGHGYSPNLHALWDTAIPEHAMEGADPPEYADTLDAAFAAEAENWQKVGIQVENWAWESHERAEKNVYGALTPKIPIEPQIAVERCTDNKDIGARLLALHLAAGAAYQEQAAPVVEEQIAKAGLRLAMILNDAAKSDAAKTMP